MSTNGFPDSDFEMIFLLGLIAMLGFCFGLAVGILAS